ncbi:TrmH family RNA methyltransferase [Gilliamella sp. ESL0250]|uniref:TrmH family RNA methyltransferase n=1 Tax=Gilliamella sp. ESL0250 TaxID=2705036 RepID=UPI001580833C|nr:TrmH family RNA methyltransferase [Gilliamella sp. ESL0250]NUF48392.1 tRNA/rRNA methyltransferase YfiF [Gilliamella sp. ESL0250]
MNDNTEKSKPTIFYATNSAPKKSARSATEKSTGWKGKRKDDSFQSKPKRDRQDRIETFKPRNDKSDFIKNKFSVELNQSQSFIANDSPWQKKVRTNEQTPTFGYDGYRQRKEETLVYSENSCKAVFKHRRTAIVKLFITQEMAYQFKDIIDWLVKQRLGYDVVSSEQISKITQTQHHGGVCLIVKKRVPLTLLDYLEEKSDREHDCVLAIDDINNPHNLGGLMRSAAFYGVNGVILRQTNLLDSGAAMRVAEGGVEAVEAIKSDDFVASLDMLKQQGYQVVALLPCQAKSIASSELHKIRFNKKVALVIFQQINMKLIDCANVVVHLKGNDNMPALNISVATGILLSNLQK